MDIKECEYCDKQFESQEVYDRHLRNEHDDDLDEKERERIYGTDLTAPSRRQLLAACGVGGIVAGAAVYDQFLTDDAEPANEFGYDTIPNDGVEVPLVPNEDAVEWFDDSDTVFVDARDETAFENARIEGALLSPAPAGQPEDDPVAELDTDTRIVTYCVCPHHLATLRGATLIREGYVHTYALDEGFAPWQDEGHPVEGEDAGQSPAVYSIEGRTDPEHAGEFAWVRHDPTGQREPSPIRDDGSFTVEIRFHEIGLDSRLQVSTPAGELVESLERLTAGIVRI